jgi:aspartyl protease family protein
VSTANGAISGSPVTIREIRVGSVVVRDVEAGLVAGGALNGNLPGMTFLNRLRRWSVEGVNWC